MVRASTSGCPSFVGVTRDALGLEDELLLVPVIVVDVGTVEALDYLRGADASFDGLVSTRSGPSHALKVPLVIP